MTLEQALTMPANRNRVTDPKGRVFESARQMCKAWKIDYGVFMRRLELGWDIEKALTTPSKKYTIELAQDVIRARKEKKEKKKNGRQMCKAWKIDYGVFMRRLELNWDMEKALTTPSKKYTIELAQDVIRARKEKKEKKQNG